VTDICKPEAEQLIASAQGAEATTFNPERGEGDCQPARRLELSVGTGRNNTAVDLEKAAKFAQRARDNGMKDCSDSISNGPLVVDTSHIPSATGRFARTISGVQAADKCTAFYSGEPGPRVQ
jgi:hypothetical protein